MDELVFKQVSDVSSLFTVDSLRLALGRSNNNLLCVLTLNNEGSLSIKMLADTKEFMIESIILSQKSNDEDSDQETYPES